MAREKDEFEKQDVDAGKGLEPMPPPGRISSSESETGMGPAPRAARFGEGKEGRAARRERGLAGAREGFFQRILTFIHDVRSEMRRVSWPSFKDVQNTTIITIIAVAFFAAYLWLVDRGWAFAINGLTKLLGG